MIYSHTSLASIKCTALGKAPLAPFKKIELQVEQWARPLKPLGWPSSISEEGKKVGSNFSYIQDHKPKSQKPSSSHSQFNALSASNISFIHSAKMFIKYQLFAISSAKHWG